MPTNRIPIIQGLVTEALAETAHAILRDDFDRGRLTPVVAGQVKDASQVPVFLQGMEIGMGYAFGLMLTGQLDLRLVEQEIKP